MTRVRTLRLDTALDQWPRKVAEAAAAFDRRWTKRALRQVDPKLYQRFQNQAELYSAAIETGTADDVERQGGGMCRAYGVVAAALATLGIEDDAYMLGTDEASGFKIAIGEQRIAIERVVERFGTEVAFFTPNELAMMLAQSGRAQPIVEVKQMFPGAEVTEIRKSK